MAQKRPGSRTPDPYTTLFDFVFATQKAGKRRTQPQPLTLPPVSSPLAEGLVQIAGAPNQYPVEQTMRDMNAEVDAATWMVSVEPVKDYKIRVGAGSVAKLLTDPGKFVDGLQKKYDEGRKYAQITGASRFMDSAMYAYLGWRSGLDANTAAAFGFNLFQQDIPVYGNMASRASHLSRYIRSQEAMRVMSDVTATKFSTSSGPRSGTGGALTKDAIEKIAADSYEAGAFAPAGTSTGDLVKGDKAARLDHMKSELMARGLTASEAETVAQKFWGDRADADDMGLWLTGVKKEGERIRQVSLDALLEKVDLQIASLPPKKIKEKKRLEAFRDRVKNYAKYHNTWQSLPFALGLGVGKVRHMRSWFGDLTSGRFMSLVFFGDVDAMLKTVNFNGALNFDVKNLIGEIELPDDNGLYKYGGQSFVRGSKVGTYTGRFAGLQAKRDIYIQNVIEGLYYWHPVNVLKGLTWDGRTWVWFAKWAENKNNMVWANRFKKIASMYPKSILVKYSTRFRNWSMDKLKKAGTKFLGRVGFFKWAAGKLGREVIGLPMREIIKQLLIKAMTVLIGATVLPGIGGILGFVADQIISLAIRVAMKFIKPLIQVGVLLLFGVIALILIFGMAIVGGPTKRMHRYVSAPISATGTPGGTVYTSADWADDSSAPVGYGCPATGGIRCTQGPCGAFSHLAYGDRAVDLVWSDMGTVGIRAPVAGTVLSQSVSSSTCSDGTEMGGQIVFQDENGYIWTFVHSRPTVASGVTVEPGDQIGVVQMGPPEVEPGGCWTAAHAHVMIRDPSGKIVDSQEFLNSAGCSFSCPAEDDC